MSIVYNLEPPVIVGDMQHQTTVKSLKIVSVSVNFEDHYIKQGHAVLSVCLADPKTGYPVNVVCQDAAALALARTIEEQIGSELFAKLIADGKLPAGSVADTTPTPTSTPTPAA